MDPKKCFKSNKKILPDNIKLCFNNCYVLNMLKRHLEAIVIYQTVISKSDVIVCCQVDTEKVSRKLVRLVATSKLSFPASCTFRGKNTDKILHTQSEILETQ